MLIEHQVSQMHRFESYPLLVFFNGFLRFEQALKSIHCKANSFLPLVFVRSFCQTQCKKYYSAYIFFKEADFFGTVRFELLPGVDPLTSLLFTKRDLHQVPDL